MCLVFVGDASKGIIPRFGNSWDWKLLVENRVPKKETKNEIYIF